MPSVRYHTARKRHVCCECGEHIEPGERYEYVAGMWEGDFCVYKTCFACLKIRNLYCPDGFTYGWLRETIWECLGFDYTTGEVAEWAEEEDAKKLKGVE